MQLVGLFSCISQLGRLADDQTISRRQERGDRLRVRGIYNFLC